MIVLFDDFGSNDWYVGQVKAALHERGAAGPIIDLLHEAPAYNMRAAAHLLAALQPRFPAGVVFFCVVDPGVGGSRDAVVMRAHDKFFVGPDNGTLSVVGARAARPEFWRITWRPSELSASFHGRDLFAPICAQLACAPPSLVGLQPLARLEVDFGCADLSEIIYIDHYGNAMTGLRGGAIDAAARFEVCGHTLTHATVFSAAPAGTAFWYVNSIGLIEFAVNQGDAARELGLQVGDHIRVCV